MNKSKETSEYYKGASKNFIVIANHEERNGKQSYVVCFNVEIASVVPIAIGTPSQ
ncbi:MAG: hypothetical protein WC599_05405 [Bacteroidales bacterium]